MRKPLLTTSVLATALVVLSACSSEATWQAPVPPAADPEVAALLPTGAYDVSGALVVKGAEVHKLTGFVNFGTAADGTECKTDYTISDVRPDTTATLTAARTLRASGGPSWWADASNLRPGDAIDSLVWKDTTNPSAPGILFPFAPAILASELSPGVVQNAGTDHLCAIGVLPRFMRLDGEQLVFDQDRAAQTVRAVRGRWIEGFLTAAGAQGSTYDWAAERLFEVSVPSYRTLIENTTITIRRLDDGGYELVQLRDDTPLVTFTFTPTEDRDVAAPEAKTYFELVAEEATTTDLSEILDGAIPDATE